MVSPIAPAPGDPHPKFGLGVTFKSWLESLGPVRAVLAWWRNQPPMQSRLASWATFLAAALLVGVLGVVWWMALQCLLAKPVMATPKLAVALGVWTLVLVIGVTVVRGARPVSASWSARLIATLGIGTALIALTMLVALTSAIPPE